MSRRTSLSAFVASAALLIALPAAAQMQDFGYCYLLGDADDKNRPYSNVFQVPASSAQTSTRKEMLEQQFARAFATGERTGWSPLCSITEAKTWGEQTRAKAEFFLADRVRKWRERGNGNLVSFVKYQPALSDATLEETLAWLKNQVDNNAGWRLGSDRAWARWSGEGCNVHITSYTNGQPDGSDAFNLADIRDASVSDKWVRLGEAKVMINARSGNAITRVDDGREGRFGAVNLDFFNNVPLARRVATALTHAAQLCSSERPRDVF